MNQYFMLDTRVEGAYLYFVKETEDVGTMIDKIVHCFYEDFLTIIPMIIKEKEIYKFKILNSPLKDYAIAQLKNLNNIEIEVIEHI